MSDNRSRLKLSTEQLAQFNKFLAGCFKSPPVSVRNVYYQAISHFIPSLPKTLGEYERISSRLVDLRLSEVVPYEYVSEGGRNFSSTDIGPSSPWHEAEIYPLVLVESVSLQGVLQATCDKYSLGLTASSGQPSITLLHKIGQELDRVGRPGVIFFIGDFDAPGYNIFDNYNNNLAEHTKTNYELVRVGITASQIIRYNLPTNPLKPSHPLRPDIHCNVEAEAMNVDDLRWELENAILQYASSEMLERAEQYALGEEYHEAFCRQVLDDTLDYLRNDGPKLNWLRDKLE